MIDRFKSFFEILGNFTSSVADCILSTDRSRAWIVECFALDPNCESKTVELLSKNFISLL